MDVHSRVLVVASMILSGCGREPSTDDASSGEASSGETTAATESTEGTTGTPDMGTPIPDPPMWDPDVPEPACALDEGDHPLLDAALLAAGLDLGTFVFTETDFQQSDQYNAGVLGGDFALSWFADTRAQPARAGCRHAQLAGVLTD